MPTLDWIGKAAVVNHHRKVPYHLLRCDRELSAGDAYRSGPKTLEQYVLRFRQVPCSLKVD